MNRRQILEHAVHLAYGREGNVVEFGVATGESTRVIRAAASAIEAVRGDAKLLFACDSFLGLPEQFENAAPGTFACTPPVIDGVEIVEGWFDDTLNDDLAARVGDVALASLDADLYSSTLTALNWLTPLLRVGSLLLFDEHLGENGSEQRAHHEWMAASGIRTAMIGDWARDPSGWGSTPDRRKLFEVTRWS